MLGAPFLIMAFVELSKRPFGSDTQGGDAAADALMPARPMLNDMTIAKATMLVFFRKCLILFIVFALLTVFLF